MCYTTHVCTNHVVQLNSKANILISVEYRLLFASYNAYAHTMYERQSGKLKFVFRKPKLKFFCVFPDQTGLTGPQHLFENCRDCGVYFHLLILANKANTTLSLELLLLFLLLD